jgi:hypothetical protein
MYLGLHVKCLIFCLILTKFGFSLQIFIKVPDMKLHRNPSSGMCADTGRDRQTKGQTWRNKWALFTTMQTHLKMTSQNSVHYTNAHTQSYKAWWKSDKVFLNWGDTMMKSWNTSAFTKTFQFNIHIETSSPFCFTVTLTYILNGII